MRHLRRAVVSIPFSNFSRYHTIRARIQKRKQKFVSFLAVSEYVFTKKILIRLEKHMHFFFYEKSTSKEISTFVHYPRHFLKKTVRPSSRTDEKNRLHEMLQFKNNSFTRRGTAVMNVTKNEVR